MSARKRVTVKMDRAEYERLMALEEDAIAARGKVNWSEAAMAAGLMQAHTDEVEARQREYHQLVRSFDRELSALEQEAGHALVAQERNFLQELSLMEIEMGRNTDLLISQQAEGIAEAFEELQDHYQQHFESIIERFEERNDHESAKQQLASNLLAEANLIFDWMRDAYQWELYKPKDQLLFERMSDQAYENFHNGLFEASISQSQNLLNDLLRARLELEQQQAEWQFLASLALQRIDNYLHLSREYRFVPPVDLAMNLLTEVDPIYVNHWSGDNLATFERELAAMREQLLRTDHQMSTDSLRLWIEKESTQFDNRLAEIVMKARYNALDAQIRRSVASIVADVLAENGFEVYDYSKENTGVQQPFWLALADDLGGEAVVDITPEQGFRNMVAIDFSDASPVMEDELQKRYDGVARVLREQGINVEVVGDESIGGQQIGTYDSSQDDLDQEDWLSTGKGKPSRGS
jgi:gas vesicle protein